MNIFDKSIENIFKKYLHKKRDHHIKKALKNFIKNHNPDPNVTDELKKLLETEALRLYPMVDKSILRERIKRARTVFIMTAMLSIILAIVISLLTNGTALIFITPIFAAMFAWIATLATIPIGYDQRIKGGMDSVIAVFEEKLMKEKSLSLEKDAKNIQNEQMQQEIDALKNLVKTLYNQNEHLQQEIENYKDIAEDFDEKIHIHSYQIDTHIKNQNKLREEKLSTDCAASSYAINQSKKNHFHFQFWDQTYSNTARPTPNIGATDVIADSTHVKHFDQDTWHQAGRLISCNA